jgi:ribosomal protein S18 acetylase RimI-like enzyme
MRIREADLPDVMPMAQVTVDTFLAAHRDQIPDALWHWRRENWTYAVSAQGWERTIRGVGADLNRPQCVYLAEEEGGQIVGVAMARALADGANRTAEVGALYVHPRWQKLGVGRRLVAAMARHLAQQGIVTLHIGALRSNALARKFYEKLGGQVVEEREVEDAGFRLREVVYCWPDIGALTSPELPPTGPDP